MKRDGSGAEVEERCDQKELSGQRGRANKGGWRKRKGEMAESRFLAKAVSLGFGVAKPWGDSERYDFIVDAGGRLWRVQVKSAFHEMKDGGYVIRAHGADGHVYTPEEVDVMVAWVMPVNAWYVVPIAALQGVTGMKLFPMARRRKSKHERYREAWEVMSATNE
jgi:hypothetical protein